MKNVNKLSLEELKAEKEQMLIQLKRNKGSEYPMGRDWYDRWYDVIDRIEELER